MNTNNPTHSAQAKTSSSGGMMSSRETELRMREQQGDLVAALTPRRCLHVRHPFTGKRQVSQFQCELVWFIDKALLSDGAQGFGQWKNADLESMCEASRYTMELFWAISFLIGDEVKDDVIKQFVTWTAVPSADNPDRHCGYLLRIVYQIDQLDVWLEFRQFLSKNSGDQKKKVAQTLTLKYTDGHHTQITLACYLSLCDSYDLTLNSDLLEKSKGADCADMESNVYFPFNVFSMDRALKKMGYAGAHPDFLDKAAYHDAGEDEVQAAAAVQVAGMCNFPRRGAHTYLIASPTQLVVQNINWYFFPHTMVKGEVSLALQEAARMSGIRLSPDGVVQGLLSDDASLSSDNDSEASRERGASSKACRAFTANFSTLMSDTAAHSVMDIDKLKEKIGKIMKPAKAIANPAERALAMREAKKQSVNLLFSLFFNADDTTDCGNAIKAIAKWKNDFLRTHRNFNMPVRKKTANLSRFAEMQLHQSSVLESVFAVNTSHKEIKSVQLAAMHVYFYTPFHAHHAMLGPPGAGKSNVFQVNIRRLIPGSYRDMGSETVKSKNVPGKDQDFGIEFYEDICPSQLGISPGTSKNAQAASVTSNSNDEAMLRYRLTKGRARNAYKAVVDGKHINIEFDSWMNTVMFCAMNATLQQLPTSVASRFVCIQFAAKNRQNAGNSRQGLMEKHSLNGKTEIKALQEQMLLRDHRNQLMHCLVGLCCHLGIFEMPDMTTAHLVWRHTLDMARAKGVQNTDNMRHIERLEFFCSSLVVEDAIDRCFDSELSPFPGRAWHNYDILDLEKHLYANTEHAAFALGLLQHMFENPIVSSLESYFHKAMFREKIETNSFGKMCSNSALQREMDDYYVVRVESASASTNPWDSQKNITEQQVMRLATYLHSVIYPKPDEQEIVHALNLLMQLQLCVTDRNSTSVPQATKSISALRFAVDGSGDLMVACELMQNFQKNRVQECLRTVLCHPHTNMKNILYGEVYEKRPYMWACMSVQPDAHNPELKETNANFFSPAVLELTYDSLKGVESAKRNVVSDSDRDVDEEAQHYETLEQKFRGNYSSTSHKDVDMDQDERSAVLQATKLGLKHLDEQVDAPGGSTSYKSFTQAILQRYDADDLKHYPDCFEERHAAGYHEIQLEDKRKHPSNYSLKASLIKREDSTGRKRKRPRHPSPPASPGGSRDMDVEGDEGAEGAAAASSSSSSAGVEQDEDEAVDNDHTSIIKCDADDVLPMYAALSDLNPSGEVDEETEEPVEPASFQISSILGAAAQQRKRTRFDSPAAQGMVYNGMVGGLVPASAGRWH